MGDVDQGGWEAWQRRFEQRLDRIERTHSDRMANMEKEIAILKEVGELRHQQVNDRFDRADKGRETIFDPAPVGIAGQRTDGAICGDAEVALQELDRLEDAGAPADIHEHIRGRPAAGAAALPKVGVAGLPSPVKG
jgi:hypothetical protein